ncbi:uncharacterized protein LOC120587340 [Pteropus medius]|uniref:uncharacterized protein LOC120587340 n=1 Tax=Pteropus vampyrus TaxID=132908 RepID=UPI00196B57A5|nr:uncharacterized protein LOC120587340 [Pteropus giganteus]
MHLQSGRGHARPSTDRAGPAREEPTVQRRGTDELLILPRCQQPTTSLRLHDAGAGQAANPGDRSVSPGPRASWDPGPLFPTRGAARLLGLRRHRCFLCSFLGPRSPVARQRGFPANCGKQLAPQTRLPGTRRPGHSPGDRAASARGPCRRNICLPGPAPPRSLWDAGRWGPATPSSGPSFPLEGPHAPHEAVPDSDSVKSNLSPGTLGALCHSALWVKHL